MNWTLVGIAAASGIILGYMLAPEGNLVTSAPDSGKVKIKTVSKPSFVSNPELMLERMFSGSSINPEVAEEMKNAADWAELIKEKGFQKAGMMDMQRQFMDMGLLLRLVPDDQLEGVLSSLGEEEPSGDMQSRWMSLYINYALADRFYAVDPQKMKQWVAQANEKNKVGRMEMLVISALEHRPADGLALFEQNKDELKSGMMSMFGGIEAKVAASKLETEGVDAYWEFYDSLPKSKSSRLPFMINHNLESGQFEQFYEQASLRWTKKSGLFSRGNSGSKDKLLADWGQADPAGLASWYSSKKAEIETGEKAKILKGLLGSNNEKQAEFVRSELVSDPSLVPEFLSSSRGRRGFTGGASFEQKLEVLPANTKISSKTVMPVIDRVKWTNPQKSLELTKYITDPDERYQTLTKMINPEELTRIGGDIEVVKKGIADLGLTEIQKNSLIAAAQAPTNEK